MPADLLLPISLSWCVELHENKLNNTIQSITQVDAFSLPQSSHQQYTGNEYIESQLELVNIILKTDATVYSLVKSDQDMRHTGLSNWTFNKPDACLEFRQFALLPKRTHLYYAGMYPCLWYFKNNITGFHLYIIMNKFVGWDSSKYNMYHLYSIACVWWIVLISRFNFLFVKWYLRCIISVFCNFVFIWN